MLEVVPAPPRAQQRLLHQVLGLVEGPEHPVAVDVQLAPVLLGPGGELGFRGHAEHHPGTRPQVALTMPEVIAPARSEARKAAVSAISSSSGGRPSMARWEIIS